MTNDMPERLEAHLGILFAGGSPIADTKRDIVGFDKELARRWNTHGELVHLLAHMEHCAECAVAWENCPVGIDAMKLMKVLERQQ